MNGSGIEPLDLVSGRLLTTGERDMLESLYEQASYLPNHIDATATYDLERSAEVAGSGQWTLGLLRQVRSLAGTGHSTKM